MCHLAQSRCTRRRHQVKNESPPPVSRGRKTAVAWLLACVSGMPAAASELALPCPGPDGQPVAGTVVKAVREDFGGEPIAAAGRDGTCRIGLPAGACWVKAEAPGMRSVAVRAVDGAAPGRVLRMHPLAGKDAQWQQRLQQMVQNDQAVRHALDDARKQGDAQGIERAERDMAKVDEQNQTQVKQWLAARGFPRAADVGFEGVGAVWLLLQHAPEVMEPYMADLRAAVAACELQRANLALSEDRIDMTHDRPQRYGSQLQRDASGKLVLYKLLNPEKVDAWRAEMDLEPLAAYLRRFEP